LCGSPERLRISPASAASSQSAAASRSLAPPPTSRIYQVVASLNAERQASDTPLDLEPLLQHASEFLSAMELIRDEKLQYSLQLDVQWPVRSAERKEELESAAHFAERQLHILDLDDLAGADEAFGRLRQRILSDYDLPTPTW
jgi:hypothetical protein